MKAIALGLWLLVAGCATSSPSEDGAGGEGGEGGGSGGSDDGGGPSGGAGGGAGAGSPSTGGGPTAFCTWGACGGDPVGPWNYSTACLPNAPVPGQCEGSSTTYLLYLTGTLEFQADGTLHAETTSVQDTIIYYPKTCWPPFASKCEDFVSAEGLDLSCVNTAEDCTCTVTATMVNPPANDTYVVEGEHLVLGDGTDFTFCADAEHLLLIHDTGEETFLARAP